MSKLEQGDLAEIIKSTDGISVGKIVTCVRLEVEEHYLLGPVWLVQSRTPIMTEFGSMGIRVHVPAKWLKKVLPPSKKNSYTLVKETSV